MSPHPDRRNRDFRKTAQALTTGCNVLSVLTAVKGAVMPQPHHGTKVLSQSDRTRLAQILGLLGSNQSGERDAAGLAAHRLVSKAGLTWYDVIEPPPPATQEQSYSTRSMTWREVVSHLLNDQPDFLTEWEWNFLLSIKCRPGISQKQGNVLDTIVQRVSHRHARYAGR